MTKIEDIMAPIKVIFKQRVANLIKMGDKGRVLFLCKNAKLTEISRLTKFESGVFELDESVYGENTALFATQIKAIFGDGVKEVLFLEYKENISSIVEEIKVLKWDWMFSTDADAQEDVALLGEDLEQFAFCYNQKADNIWVVSLNNPKATLTDDSVLQGVEILPYVVGVLAGCPYNMSVSYKTFEKFKHVTLPETIEEGFLTLYNEEEGVRIASPVNTLVTTNETYTEDMKSICIVEGVKRYDNDLKVAFRTGYKGKYKNNYDNQALFYGAVDYYHGLLEEAGVLDPEYDNKIGTDVEAQRKLWKAQGKEAETWDDLTVKRTTYKDMVVAKSDIKFLFAMEGLQLTAEMF